MNGYGLYDMSGNVWERVSDWYDNSFYESSPVNNPQGPSAGTVRGKRGGGFYNVSKRDLRTSNRYFVNPSEIHEGLGFRCARTLR
jgi:formylglycine-generating enzyme required for sulfatase activity